MVRAPWFCLALAFATPAFAQLSVSPPSLDFGGQSMGTTSPALTLTVMNNGSTPATISSVTRIDPQFGITHNCITTLAPSATCAIQVTFTPASPFLGELNETMPQAIPLFIASDAPGSPTTVNLAGTGERSLVTHFYRAILRRAPDDQGKAYWLGEASRLRYSGANPNETWFAMAAYFFRSSEYFAFGRDDAGFVTDLYNTFFNRVPDQQGFDFWIGQLASGLPREVALTAFMFSNEFVTFSQGVFGTDTARPEVNVVTDFYRGLLARLPDEGGLFAWAESLRTVQCGAGTVAAARAQAGTISTAFAADSASRNRTNVQFVGDLYNAFLRRGGDLQGVSSWINQLSTGALTRDQVRQAFLDSAEFTGRLQAMIDRGCLSHGTATVLEDTAPAVNRQSLAIGIDGKPFVGYVKGSTLNLVRCGDAACTTRTAQTFTDFLNLPVSVAVGAGGRPLATTVGSSPGGPISLLVCGDAPCATSNVLRWYTYSALGATVPWIDVSAGGIAALAYRPNPNGSSGGNATTIAICTDESCSQVITRDLNPSVRLLSQDNVIDVRWGGDGFPVVMYGTAGSDNPKLAKCSSQDCASFSTISLPIVGTGFRFRLAAADTPMITYTEIPSYPTPHPRLFLCTPPSCDPTITYALGPAASPIAMAIRPDSRPVLLFGPQNARIMLCGDMACSSNNTVTVLGGMGATAEAVGLALDAQQRPVVLMKDGSGRLVLLSCADQACASN